MWVNFILPGFFVIGFSLYFFKTFRQILSVENFKLKCAESFIWLKRLLDISDEYISLL